MASTTAARARWHRRCRSSGYKKGEHVATLCWNHHAHLEADFGVPAASGWMHTLNLRLAPADLGEHLLKNGFARWQLPDRYEVIDAVPRTSTGKFYRLRLRERFPG